MDKTCFILTALIVLLALLIVFVVVLKDGKFRFSLKTRQKKDALLIEAEHHDNIDIDK